jgi:beta-alanine degradation protein BauB
MRVVWSVCLAGVLAAVPAAAQDAVKVAPNTYHVVAENDRVRVLHVAIAPKVKIAMHEHPKHLVIPLAPASVRFTTPDGKSADVAMKTEEVGVQPAGKHSSESLGPASEAIVIELKGAAGTAALPADRPGMKSTTLFEDADAKAVRVSIDPSFKEAPGTTHDYHQVVITLGTSDIKLSFDGKTTTSWKRGEVRLIGKGVAHESAGGKTAGEAIIVAIK